MSRSDLLVVAGESSGDLHGSRLLAALATRLPGVTAFGLGGDRLAAAGMRLLADSSEISVVGITEALDVLPRAAEIMDRLLIECERRRPGAAVLIDYPEFNLRLARRLKWLGIPIVYYVSPQIWAWRRGRVRAISELVDRMLVLFAFEEQFYRDHGIAAVHVGHPIVEEVPLLKGTWDDGRVAEPIRELRIALLPGSRRSEVEALLPRMVGAVRELRGQQPVAARLIQASSIADGQVARLVGDEPLEIVRDRRFAAIAECHLALCASGTATLEVGLLGTPMIVLYHLAPWTYRLARLLVKVPYFSLVNLVLDKAVVPELLQEATAPAAIAARVRELVHDVAAIRTMRRDLAGLRGALGAPGASARAAAEVAGVLQAGGRA